MRKKLLMAQLAATIMAIFAQNAIAARFDFVGLLDANPSQSVTVISDDPTIQATITSNSPNTDGVGVSFNQGLGVVDVDGLQTDINDDDVLTITFNKAVDVGLIGLRLWGDAIGGDSANVSGFTPLLFGPGDAGSGTVDLFTINLTNVTSFQVIGRGNVNSGVGGFFLGELDNVTEATPPVMPSPIDIDGNGEVNALTDGLLIIRYLFGIRGDALIEGSVANDCSRCTVLEIETFLQGLIS